MRRRGNLQNRVLQKKGGKNEMLNDKIPKKGRKNWHLEKGGKKNC